MPYWAWKNAAERLDMMIRRAHRGFADPKSVFTFRRVYPVRTMPVLLPAKFGDILYGPDGKPMMKGTR